MMIETRVWRVVCGAVCGLFLAAGAWGGPLTPPAGPVAPTPGPEPRIGLSPETTPGGGPAVYTILEPGSYYLEGNVSPTPGQRGIDISASGVTLDLNGFTIDGAGASGDGIASFQNDDITIMNGFIRDAGGYGVNSLFSDRVRIEGVVVNGTGDFGIAVGNDSLIVDCVATACAGPAIYGGNSVIVERSRGVDSQRGFSFGAFPTFLDCVAEGNSLTGFRATGRAVADGCAATLNGTEGFNFQQGGRLVDCVAQFNGSGYQVFGDGEVLRCTARDSGSWGFYLADGKTLLVECVSIGNGNDGVRGAVNGGTGVGGRVTMRSCVVQNNGGDGVELDEGVAASISGCGIVENNGHGVIASLGSVEGNTIAAHALDGVRMTNGGSEAVTIRNNTVLASFQNGIVAEGPAHIEGNTVDFAFLSGIQVWTDSAIIGNTVRRAREFGAGVGDGAIRTNGGGNRIDSNATSGGAGAADIRYLGDRNIIVRNTLDEGAITAWGVVSKTVLGPTNDLNSPWANFLPALLP